MAMKALCLGSTDKKEEAYALVRESIRINIRCGARNSLNGWLFVYLCLSCVLPVSLVVFSYMCATGARHAGTPSASSTARTCKKPNVCLVLCVDVSVPSVG